MSVRILIALIRKDLQLFAVDRRAMLISLVLPIAMASFFGFLFSGRDAGEPSRIAIRLVDQDHSEVSRRLVASLGEDRTFEVVLAGLDDARAAVQADRAVAAVVVPPGFGAQAGAALASGAARPELVVLHDPSRPAELAVVRGALPPHVIRAVIEATAGAAAPRLPYDVREEAVTAGDGVAYNGYAHSFAGMGLQFVLMGALEAGIAVLLQRQRGLWKRLRAAPLSRGMLLGSRALSSALISLLTLGVLFGFGAAVFGVRVEGSLLGFLGVCAATAMMAASFGLLVAALGRTPEATRGISIFVTLVIVMLGGAWVPSFLFPAWLQDIAAVTPTRWAMDGLDAMLWRGLPLHAALAPIAVLLGFTALFGTAAALRFRWDAE